MAKKKSNNSGGDCYYVSGQFALNNVREIGGQAFIGTPYLVHAEVSGQGSLLGIGYGHAWIEDDVLVYDFSNGRDLIFPKDIYYKIGKVVTKKPQYFKYTFEEARKKMATIGTFGCWDLITSSGL
jgi:hypothetical protein